jgi:glycosyltransferase involved in cell wall biosynthesis
MQAEAMTAGTSADGRALRVCVTSADYLPNPGGVAAHVAGLAGGLARQGARVTVLVPSATRDRRQAGASREAGSGFRVVRAAAWAPPRLGWLLRPPAYLRALRSELDGPLDVFHWHNPGLDPEAAARVRARLRVFTNHTSHFLEWSLGGQSPRRARAAVRHADVVLCPSQELVEATLTTGFPADRVFFVTNGVDTHRFAPGVDGAAVRARLGFGPEDVVFLCPRRLEKKNGVPYWLRALPEVVRGSAAPVRFLLVGDYPGRDVYSDRDAVAALIGELGLGDRLVWVGSVPPAEMPQHVAAADVVVLPSLMEATSIAGLEAMAAGKPLLGTNVGGIPQILEDGRTGLLVPPADAQALAAAMLRLADDPDGRRRMGAAGRAAVESRFSWDAVGRTTLDIYLDAMERLNR